jgi:hypothetical protein
VATPHRCAWPMRLRLALLGVSRVGLGVAAHQPRCQPGRYGHAAAASPAACWLRQPALAAMSAMLSACDPMVTAKLLDRLQRGPEDERGADQPVG